MSINLVNFKDLFFDKKLKYLECRFWHLEIQLKNWLIDSESYKWKGLEIEWKS